MTARRLLKNLLPVLASVPIGAGAQPALAAPHAPQGPAPAAVKARPSSFQYRAGRDRHAPRSERACPHASLPRSGGTAAPRGGVCRARVGARRHGQHRPATPSASRLLGQPSAALPHADTIAQVLATPCQNVTLTPDTGNLPLVREAVLCLVNRERAQSGELPLTLNPALEAAAEAHAQEMISGNYFEHVAPSGLTPVGRVRADGYLPDPNAGYVVGENIAWGTLSLATPQAIVAAWIASPEHLANILESQYRETGIGIAPQVPALLSGGQPGATYAQAFGVVIP